MTAIPLLDGPDGREGQKSPLFGGCCCVRALHVINGEHYSGAERVQDLLAVALPSYGFGVGFVCLKPGRFDSVRSSQAPVHGLSMGSRFDLRPVWQLVRLLRQQRYHLLHAHTPRSLLVAGLASRWTGVPLVYHVHSPTSRDSTRPWQNRINALIERGCFPLASELIAVSQSLGQHLRSLGVPPAKVTVVPNGVPRRRARPPRPLDCDEFLFGTVALFRPRKGIEVLLDAMAMLRREGLPVRLRAVGGFESTAYKGEILQRTKKLNLDDAVTWAGFQQDVDAELARMDVFVLPSLFGEGLPMVILEAMAAGLPVVATEVEGVPEAIREGREGLLVAPGNATDLARALARIVRGEVAWSEMRRAALRRHADGFSDRAMAAGVARVYRRVLDKQAIKVHRCPNSRV